jgi:transcription elongation GreA/GreB family factor
MNKQAILDAIRSTLAKDLESVTRGARDSAAAASDPDSKAENKYDTRTLEASYVARGQAQRVVELQEAVQLFGGLSGNDCAPDSAITLGALVTLNREDHYFLGPAAGGTAVLWETHEVLVVTPSAPLGQKLLGKRAGDRVELRPGLTAAITAVQ